MVETVLPSGFPTVCFGDIPIGDFFLFENCVCIKTQSSLKPGPNSIKYGYWNNDDRILVSDTRVIPLDATITTRYRKAT